MNLQDLRELLRKPLLDTDYAGKVYLAGGAVRDYLLGRAALDFDICVNLPDGGIQLAKYLSVLWNLPKPVIHSKFGTASLAYQGLSLEFVMTRSETYKPGNRNPRVEFADLRTDVLRRDFTINSLLMDIFTGEVLDLCQMGLSDLEAGLIRCIRDPLQVFAEDPLRILRAIRFALQLGFEIETDTYSALRLSPGSLKNLSKVLHTREMLKIMSSKDKERARHLLRDCGLI